MLCLTIKRVLPSSYYHLSFYSSQRFRFSESQDLVKCASVACCRQPWTQMTERGGNTKRKCATPCVSRVILENIQITFSQEIGLTKRFNASSIALRRSVG
jgi:hypothetical protein